MILKDIDATVIEQQSFSKTLDTSTISSTTKVNKSGFTVVIDEKNRKKGTQQFWMKEKLTYKLLGYKFEIFNDVVSLVVDIKNAGKEHFSDVIRIKGRNLTEQIDQPINKRIRAKHSTKITINLKMDVNFLMENIDKSLYFEFTGTDEKNNTKYFSDGFTIKIDQSALSGLK